MKLIGFSQLRNESENGNLGYWLQMMSSICDYVYIFDQASTDDSHQKYLQHSNVVVTYSPTNRFTEELVCKQELIDRVYADHSDVSWVLWLDGDTMVTCEPEHDLRQTIRNICSAHSNSNGVRIPHYNLWRSDSWFRTDNNYHWLHMRRVPLWNATIRRLTFDVSPGLHKIQKPIGITPENTAIDTSCSLLHRGFATVQQIIKRYDLYKAFGQTGSALERLLDENGLSVQQLSSSRTIPAFNNNVDPRTLQPIRAIYDQKH